MDSFTLRYGNQFRRVLWNEGNWGEQFKIRDKEGDAQLWYFFASFFTATFGHVLLLKPENLSLLAYWNNSAILFLQPWLSPKLLSSVYAFQGVLTGQHFKLQKNPTQLVLITSLKRVFKKLVLPFDNVTLMEVIMSKNIKTFALWYLRNIHLFFFFIKSKWCLPPDAFVYVKFGREFQWNERKFHIKSISTENHLSSFTYSNILCTVQCQEYIFNYTMPSSP